MRSRSAILSAILFCCSIACVLSKISFVKDQSDDAVFPPVLVQSESGLPMGHLRPLGWQRRAKKKITSVNPNITAQEMYRKAIVNDNSFLIRNAVNMKVVENWQSDEYLKETFGNISVAVTVKKELLRKKFLKTMTFKKFLLDYMYEDWLLTNNMPQEMEKEIPVPSFVACGSFMKFIQEAEVWMSSGGTSSLLHSHDDHTLHCVISGRKDFILIQPDFKDIFEYKAKYPGSKAGSSPLDMDMINMFKNKNIAQVPWYYATLRAGDCIFVSAGMLHQVRSYGRSLSYTILIAPYTRYYNNMCHLTKQKFLSDFHMTWSFINGTRQLSHKTLRPKDVRFHLLKLMRTAQNLTYPVFEDFYYDVMQYFPAPMTPQKAFQYLDPKQTGLVTKKDFISTIKLPTLEKLAKVLNAPRLKGRDVIIHDEF